MIAILIIGLVALIALFIFWTAFRDWLGRQLDAIWTIIVAVAPGIAAWLLNAFNWVGRAVGRYAFILLCVAAVVLVLMIVGLFIPWPAWSAFLFVLAICLVLLAWFPAGVILRLFRLTDAVVPRALRALIAWIAFVGFLCLMCPDVITIKTLLGAALVGFIFFGSTFKTKAIDKLIVPLVVCMCLWTAYGYFWPESFRSNIQIAESFAKRLQSVKDRTSRENETYAATTYAVALRDIVALYECSHDTVLTDVAADTVKRGTIVKLVSRKHEIKVIDEQGFVEIQLANKKGLFVGGQNKYYVEAEFVELATPRDITPKEDLKDLLKKQTPTTVSVGQKVGGEYMVGEHQLALKNGEESGWCTIQPCHAYMFSEVTPLRVQLIFEDGTSVNSWELKKWPNKYKFRIKNLGDEMPILKVI